MKVSPTTEDQLELVSIDLDFGEKVSIPRSKDTYNIKWMKPYTLERLSVLELTSGMEIASQHTIRDAKKRAKFLSKAASYIILNSFSIMLFHKIYWRYLYYLKGYSSEQLLPIIQTAKKKAQQLESYVASVLVSQMKTTNPALTQEEAEHIRSELTSGISLPSEKSTDGL